MKRWYFRLYLVLFCLVIVLIYPGRVFSDNKNEPAKDKTEPEEIIDNWPVKLIGTISYANIPEDKKKPVDGQNKMADFSGPIIAEAQNSRGEIYLIKNSPPRILVFDNSGKFQLNFGTEGNKEGELSQPFSIAIDNQDIVYVCDVRRGKVLLYTPTGDFMEEFSSKSALAETDEYQKASPGCISIDKKNSLLYISDPANGHIWIHDLKGKFLRYMKGKEPGVFCTPGIIQFDKGGKIYVPEGMCDRIRVFDQDGAELLHVGGESGDRAGQFSRLSGIAVNSGGRIYAADLMLKCIQVFSPQGKLIGVIKWLNNNDKQVYFQKPIGLFTGHNDSLFVLDQGGNEVYMIKDEN